MPHMLFRADDPASNSGQQRSKQGRGDGGSGGANTGAGPGAQELAGEPGKLPACLQEIKRGCLSWEFVMTS